MKMYCIVAEANKNANPASIKYVSESVNHNARQEWRKVGG